MSWASRHNLLARAVNRHLGGVSVTWGAVLGVGILEQNAQLVSGDNVISIDYVLHNLPTADFEGLKYGDSILADGRNFQVREPMIVGDGAYMMVSLTAANLSSLLLESGGSLLMETGAALALEVA